MIYIFALLSSLSLFASPVVENIGSVNGRLESMSCRGARVAPNSSYLEILALVVKNCPNGIMGDACFKKAVIKKTKYVDVSFQAKAVPNKTDIEMKVFVTETGLTLSKTLRRGYWQGPVNEPVALSFDRVKYLSGDDFNSIETSFLTNGKRKASYISVPVVNESYIKDRIYFFFDCDLEWSY